MTDISSLILYVDDERSNRVVFEHAFNDQFTIETVDGPHAALETLAMRDVAVLVTDQRMPGMTGNDLLTEAKAKHPNTVRIVITAYSDFDPLLKAVNDGLVARYVIKPWDADELRGILSWALEAYRLGVHDSALQLRLIETERLVTLGSISSAILHDLRQPASFLTMNTGLLQQFSPVAEIIGRLLDSDVPLSDTEARTLREFAEELPALARDMEKGCEVVVGLLNDSEVVRRPSVDQEPADPLPLVRYSISVVRSAIVLAGGTVMYEGPDELPPVAIPAVSLAQILINALSNAAQALEASKQRGARVVVSTRRENDTLVFIVSDSGPGMTQEVLDKLGTPFFTTRPRGSGLGVAQCRRLAEGAGGSVAIRSAVGEGTTVEVSLPVTGRIS